MRRNRKSYTLVDSYKEYRKENPEDSGFSLSKIDYRNICIAFNQRLSDGIIEQANEFNVPGRLGLIKIKKFPTRNNSMRVDWAQTKKYNKKIYHLNMHTDGYYYKWYWSKANAIFKNKSVYSFKPNRTNKRILAKLLKENKVEFFE
jgi:hypothetical protein